MHVKFDLSIINYLGCVQLCVIIKVVDDLFSFFGILLFFDKKNPKSEIIVFFYEVLYRNNL